MINNDTFDTRESMNRRKGVEYLLSKAFVPISQLINMDRKIVSVWNETRTSRRSFFNRQRDAVQRTADGALEPRRFTTS